MQVLAFGRLSNLGVEGVEVPTDVTDSDALRRFLGIRWPELNAPGVLLAINQMLVRRNTALSPDDEVAFLPPMSGG
jgi:molybdopterin converting factor small subunit